MNELCAVPSPHDLLNQNTIGGKFIIAMIRDHDLFPRHQL
jgi:hypothetical protein